MNWIDMLKILAVTCGLMGVVLNIKKERLCFLLWFVSNGCWAWLTRAEYLLSVQFGAFCIFCIYGFFAWRPKKDKRRKTRTGGLGGLPQILEHPPMPPVKPPRDENAPPLITAKLSELTFRGTEQDAEIINELKRRLRTANSVMERLLYKLRHTRPGATKLRAIKKKT